ncbi:unnamed protein product [Caenorhabditis brenneri]
MRPKINFSCCITPWEDSTGRIEPGDTLPVDFFNWKCTKLVDNGKLSAEPVTCLYGDKYVHPWYELKAGESVFISNGTVKISCDIVNGGLRRSSEVVPGCFYNGTVYQIGEDWTEENPGDKNSSHKIWMTCQRGESGYFEKKVLGCVLKRKLGDYSGPNTAGEVDLTEIIDKKIMLGEVEWRIYDEEIENRDNSLCVETEPGHVALKKATEEEIGCTHKNQFHPYRSHWDDLEMGASLFCDDHKKVVKNRCAVNGRSLWVSPFIDYKLSNGCTFICNGQKNILKCPEQLSFLEVKKTATTRIPTTLKAELGF